MKLYATRDEDGRLDLWLHKPHCIETEGRWYDSHVDTTYEVISERVALRVTNRLIRAIFGRLPKRGECLTWERGK